MNLKMRELPPRYQNQLNKRLKLRRKRMELKQKVSIFNIIGSYFETHLMSSSTPSSLGYRYLNNNSISIAPKQTPKKDASPVAPAKAKAAPEFKNGKPVSQTI
jgi:hypothetical protein